MVGIGHVGQRTWPQGGESAGSPICSFGAERDPDRGGVRRRGEQRTGRVVQSLTRFMRQGRLDGFEPARFEAKPLGRPLSGVVMEERTQPARVGGPGGDAQDGARLAPRRSLLPLDGPGGLLETARGKGGGTDEINGGGGLDPTPSHRGEGKGGGGAAGPMANASQRWTRRESGQEK